MYVDKSLAYYMNMCDTLHGISFNILTYIFILLLALYIGTVVFVFLHGKRICKQFSADFSNNPKNCYSVTG